MQMSDPVISLVTWELKIGIISQGEKPSYQALPPLVESKPSQNFLSDLKWNYSIISLVLLFLFGSFLKVIAGSTFYIIPYSEDFRLKSRSKPFHLSVVKWKLGDLSEHKLFYLKCLQLDTHSLSSSMVSLRCQTMSGTSYSTNTSWVHCS